jgi:crotonobetainyl-CoA:carnitine CoA-transferase CaiB-like acyl-CoA transferase
VTIPSAPYKFSETPAEFRQAAPLLGEHNEDVFGELLGCSKQEMVKMRETGII